MSAAVSPLLLPAWVLQRLSLYASALPDTTRGGKTAPLTTRVDAAVTIIILIALLYMTAGALLRHVKEGVELDAARSRVRVPATLTLLRWYTGVSLVLSVLLFLLDAGTYMQASVLQAQRNGIAPRLVNFWSCGLLLLNVDLLLTGAATLRPLVRLFAHLSPPARAAALTQSRLWRVSEAVGELSAAELLVTRIGFLGACYVLAFFGR
jgi:hypothetical protein